MSAATCSTRASLAVDVERAAQWCEVADSFIESYGSPFLYAECRLLYGGVLVAKGKWQAAESALAAALRATADDCPGLEPPRIEQAPWACASGEDRSRKRSELLARLDDRLEGDEEAGLVRAALRLAEGDGAGAARLLEQRLELLSGLRCCWGRRSDSW